MRIVVWHFAQRIKKIEEVSWSLEMIDKYKGNVVNG